MTKLQLTCIWIVLFGFTVNAQEYFEGVLEYRVSYEAIAEYLTAELLEQEFGTSFTAYVQEDRYAMIYSDMGEAGSVKIIVALKEGYSYTDFEKSDTIYRTKFSNENEKLIEFKRNSDNKKQILGEWCESISMKIEYTADDSFYEETSSHHYFNPKYKLNPTVYKNYSNGFWNLYVAETSAISLRNETVVAPLFKTIDEVISIKPMPVSDTIFYLNPNKVIVDK